jgi:hypothetical protein
MKLSLGMAVVGAALGLLYLFLVSVETERESPSERTAELMAWVGLLACYLTPTGLLSSLLIAIFHANQWLSLGTSLLLASPLLLLARRLEPW